MSKNKLSNYWQIKKLGEICSFVGGGTPSKNNPDFWNGGIPWASIKDIKGQYLTKTTDYITDEGLKKSATNVANPNEIILATRINPGRPIITKIQTSINQDLKIVRPKIEIDNTFLYYLFLNIENDIIKLSNGTTVLGITLNSLNEIDIHLPPLQIQQAIVSKIEELFSELDKGIEDLKTAQQQLKTYRQSVLKWAFEGKLTNENVKEGELPEGWKMVKMSTIIKLSSLKHNPEILENLFYIGLEHIEKHTGKLTPSVGIEKITTIKNKFSVGDILYGKLRPNLNKVYLSKEEGVCSTDILVLKLEEKCIAKYLHQIMISRPFVNEMSENTSGVNLPRVSTKFIMNYEVPLPPLKEQHRIVEEIESRLSVADKMEESIAQSLQQAEALRQSILKKAFSGELVK